MELVLRFWLLWIVAGMIVGLAIVDGYCSRKRSRHKKTLSNHREYQAMVEMISATEV